MTTTPNTTKRRRTIIMSAGLLAWLTLLVSCDKAIPVYPNAYLPFTLQEVEGHATLETPRFTMVFEGEEYENSSSGKLQIAGATGPTEVTAGELKAKYANSVCTVTFRTYTLTLKNEAKRVTINGTDIENLRGKRVITVKKDGSVITEDK